MQKGLVIGRTRTKKNDILIGVIYAAILGYKGAVTKNPGACTGKFSEAVRCRGCYSIMQGDMVLYGRSLTGNKYGLKLIT